MHGAVAPSLMHALQKLALYMELLAIQLKRQGPGSKRLADFFIDAAADFQECGMPQVCMHACACMLYILQ